MTYRIVVVDYAKDRLNHLKGRLEENFPKKTAVFTLLTSQNGRDVDHEMLKKLPKVAGEWFWGLGPPHRIDVLIAHIGGNPPGHECLKSFKKSNPAGKAILYTKSDTLRLDQFRDLRLANEVVRRAQNDKQVFPNDAEMLEVVRRVRGEQPIVPQTSPFKSPRVIAAIFGLGSAMLGLGTAVVKLLPGLPF